MYNRELEAKAGTKAQYNRDQKTAALARRDGNREWNRVNGKSSRNPKVEAPADAA